MKTCTDSKRGCGWRKPGGLYLVSQSIGIHCGKLPVALTVCPCCGVGIKPTRGWTWVNAAKLLPVGSCKASSNCAWCPLFNPPEKAGLIWIGEQFYKTVDDFNKEAGQLGISRRISTVPRGFKLGETWVLLAHRTAVDGNPGIFSIFKPSAIEYITTGKETEEELAALEKRGITPVKVEKVGTTIEMKL